MFGKRSPEAEADTAEAPRKAKKLKAASTEPVTQEKFDALEARFRGFQKVTAIAVLAIEDAVNSPGYAAGSPRKRLEKIAAVASDFGLSAAEAEELRNFLDLIGQASSAEHQREFKEAQARTRPLTFDSIRPLSWRG